MLPKIERNISVFQNRFTKIWKFRVETPDFKL